ncbi:hypothetical protein [Bradyrhizobium sp. B120]|uniref:hypothetical protein n=1 Tax=Bradyrhizobium sp. B120 TaxID=3410088 RepID=UPI003B980A29
MQVQLSACELDRTELYGKLSFMVLLRPALRDIANKAVNIDPFEEETDEPTRPTIELIKAGQARKIAESWCRCYLPII